VSSGVAFEIKGYEYLKLDVPENVFTALCYDKSKDLAKCDYCEFRFKCYST
jgi:hypothetical protein